MSGRGLRGRACSLFLLRWWCKVVLGLVSGGEAARKVGVLFLDVVGDIGLGGLGLGWVYLRWMRIVVVLFVGR